MSRFSGVFVGALRATSMPSELSLDNVRIMYMITLVYFLTHFDDIGSVIVINFVIVSNMISDFYLLS